MSNRKEQKAMEKTLLYLIMAACLVGCAKELTSATEENPTGKPVTFEINVLETRAAKTTWANGDAIYVFFKGLENKYLVLNYDGSSWTNTTVGSFLSTDFENVAKTLTAVHFPVTVDVNYANKKFSFTKDGEPVYNYYLYETDVAYMVDGTTVSASLALGKPEGIAQFHVAGARVGKYYTFGCSLVQPVACASVSTVGVISEEVLHAGARLSGVADSDGAIFGGRLTTIGSANYTFTFTTPTTIYTLERTGRALEGGKMYNFPALTASDWSVQKASDLYVDLGLTSKLKWAKCNLGAAEAEEYGDLFAWGELTPKFEYSWSTYFDNPSGDGQTFIKYATDKKTKLDLADDAANAALGCKFRMPTSAEWTELRTECTWDWKTTEDGYAVNGYLVSSKKNDNTIFLPAAGFKYRITLRDCGRDGYYLSSSLDTNNSRNSLIVSFYSQSVSESRGARLDGFSVRPVYK